MRRLLAGCTIFVTLLLAACGGGGGNAVTPEELESRIADRTGDSVSCSETTKAGSDLQAFSCANPATGETIVVTEGGDGILNAVVTRDGSVVDFFVVD